MFSSSRKRQRVGSSSRLSSSLASDLALISTPNGFNDSSTADVILRLDLLNGDPDPNDPDPNPNPSESLDLHLHSSSLRRSRYFSALLSDRWQQDPAAALTLKVDASRTSAHRPFDSHVAVIRLLYSSDFGASVLSVSDALDLLPVALELVFEDLVAFCIRFIEAVPWTEDEEARVLQILPFLSPDESRDILARIFPPDPAAAEEMLCNLVSSVFDVHHPKIAIIKVFVGKILREQSDRDLVRKVLDRAFLSDLGKVKELVGEYVRPDFRVIGDNAQMEAIHKMKLHTAAVNTKHMLWLVERMIELRVADVAAREWSEQGVLTAELMKSFREDAWRSVAPGLPALVMRCTGSIANAVVAGSVIVPKQVRMKIVKDWLPLLNLCQDINTPLPSGHKLLHQEMEETFLRIISTLPMPDAKELLQQCLGFSTRNLDDCPHLVGAFTTWFRRAKRPPHDENAARD